MTAELDKQIRPDRVAVYIRWSTEEQGDGTTLAEQREGCDLYIRSQGWFLNPELVFIDDGYSGATLERPGMRQLRDLVQRGEVDCVVVFKIDRLSRNIVDATQLVLVEWAGRCHLRCVRQPIDTTSETGRLIFSVLATFADFERAQIRERTFMGRIRRLKEGKAYGSPTLAYGLISTGQPGVRALDPQRAPVVAELFRKVREERASVYDLAEWLKAQGIPPMKGQLWRYNTLRGILTNPIYAGRIVYGRDAHLLKANGKSYRHVRREVPLVDVQALTVPPIVSQEVFDEVQAIIQDRASFHKEHRRATDGTHLLSGIASCRCGAPMHIHWSRSDRYYICSRRVAYGPSACTVDNGTVKADQVERAVVDDLMAVFGDKTKREEAARMTAKQTPSTIKALNKELTRLRSEKSRVEKRLNDLRTAAGLGDLSLQEWRELRTPLEDKGKGLSEQISVLEDSLKRHETGKSEEQLILRRMQSLDRWGDLTTVERKEILRQLTERIELFKPRGWKQKYQVEVVWRIQGVVIEKSEDGRQP